MGLLILFVNYKPPAAVAASRSTSSLAIQRASLSAVSTSSIFSNRAFGVRASTLSITSGIPKNGSFRSRKAATAISRSEEHTSELQSPDHLVCRLLLEKKKIKHQQTIKRQHVI